MIPLRVLLQGFLCYKDEQEVNFANSSLWMLSGLNGSGKSTIFDAITYSLFGHHRGGSRDAHELINKDSNGAVVEFDFSLDGQPFRAYRTLQRTKQGTARGTQQLFKLLPDGKKEALRDTNLKSGFDQWIQENIGLTYETFTSSVLLLQGRAEKLLDSTAKGRFEVLAGIVDLGRYERLHRKADEQRRAHEAQAEKLSSRLDGVPAVDDAALDQAAEVITAAEAARQQAETEVERLQQLEVQAQRWQDLRQRLEAATQRWQQAQRLFAEAADIERDVARLRELREVLPRLETIMVQRRQIDESDGRTRDLTAQKQNLTDQLAEADHALEQTRQKRSSLERLIEADERKLREVGSQFRIATGRMEKLREYEKQEELLQRLQRDLARLPGEDPAATLARARQEEERLAAVDRVVPPLARLAALRRDLRQTLDAEKRALTEKVAVEARGKQLGEECRQLELQLQQAEQARAAADDQATAARTLLEQAQQNLAALHQIDGAKMCRHCGQALTPGHIQEEKRRRGQEVTDAQARYRAADLARTDAVAHEQATRERLKQVEQQRQQARDDYRDQRTAADQARRDVERLQRECRQVYDELAEPFRGRVSPAPPADWTATVYPADAELAGLRGEAAKLPGAREQVREADQILQKWTKLKAQETTLRGGLERLRAELPPDHQAVRQEHSRLESEEKALEHTLAARRAEAVDAQKQIDRLGQSREKVQKELVKVDGLLNTEDTTRQLCRQTLAREQKQLPPTWKEASEDLGVSTIGRWRAEKAQLEAQGTDQRGQQLQQARAGLDALRADREELERQQEQFPAEARQDWKAVQGLLQQARKGLRDRDEELAQARHQKALLESHRQQRMQLQQECLRAEKERTHAKLLADLLGRDRLQLYLVRQAERQVVDFANVVLDRLSGGQLYLRLCGEADGDGNTAKALELEAYNRSTGEKPINVAFLSGSQKFRVAVSLAMGIGQYASRQHRPIESVIIDEGFGCLDRQGRQVMIQELQNLRGHLHCILLVSHQEEFAEAFKDGYHFELEDGATRVRPFQR